MSDPMLGRDGDASLGLIVVTAIFGFVYLIYKILTLPPDVHEPTPVPTVQTTCHEGQVWTIHYFKGSQHRDDLVLVNGSPVECKNADDK